MSNLKEKLAKGGVTAVIVITILAVCYGLSWIVTCGMNWHFLVQIGEYIVGGEKCDSSNWDKFEYW